MLPLPVLDQVERLQSSDDVVLRDGGHGAQVFDAQRPPELYNYPIIQLSRDNPINNAMDIQGKAFKQLKSVLASVTIRCPSKRASLEQFGHKMAAIATPRLPGGPSGFWSRNTVC